MLQYASKLNTLGNKVHNIAKTLHMWVSVIKKLN